MKIASEFGLSTPAKTSERGSSRSSSVESNNVPIPNRASSPKMSTVGKDKKWQKAHKYHFINLLVQERRLNRIGAIGIRKCDWVRIAEALNAICKDTDFTYSQIQGKYNRIKLRYKEFKKCKESSGFGWDASKCKITATASVWEAHIVKFPKHARFQKKGMMNFELLQEIFDKTFATGEFSRSSTQVPLSPGDLENIGPDNVHLADDNPLFCEQPLSRNRRSQPEYSDIETVSTKRGRDNDLYNQTMQSIILGFDSIRESKRTKPTSEEDNPLDVPPAETKCATDLQALRKAHNFSLEQFHLTIPHFKEPFWRRMWVVWTDEEKLFWINSHKHA